MKNIHFTTVTSSLGIVLIAKSENGICLISMSDDADMLILDMKKRLAQSSFTQSESHLKNEVAQILNLIDSPASKFDLPLDIQGTTFQRQVWQALQKIPAGKTVSYTDIANQIGSPKSVRAVAQACGANSLAVVIPCHRVVRKNGDLSGYRWGVERKKNLLSREMNLLK